MEQRKQRTTGGFARLLAKPPVVILVLLGLVTASAGTALAAGAISVGRRVGPSSLTVRPEVPATPMDQGLGLASNSPVLAADPIEPQFMALANRVDAPDFSCALQVSGDGGRGWVSANPVPRLPVGVEKCYAPDVAFDGRGVLYYLFVGLAGAGNEPMGVFLTTSSDQARTFSTPRQVLGPYNFGARMTIDSRFGPSGRLHLVWLHASSDPPLGGFGPPPNPIMAAYSDDGGRTFSEAVTVSDPQRDRVAAPSIVLGAEGAVHVAYYDLHNDERDYRGLDGPTWDGFWSLVLASSIDQGRTFGAGAIIDPAVVPSERVMLIFTMPPPTLVADEGRICVAWTDGRHGDADVLLRCSLRQREGWGDPKRLNDDVLGNGRSQYLPRLSLSTDGRLDAIFYDRRNDSANRWNETFYTFSTDGGQSFSPNRKLTRHASDSQIGQQYLNPSAKGQVEFGAGLGLLSLPTGAVAAWTDTRNSRPVTTGQDVFVTEIAHPTSSTRGSTAVRLAGAVLFLLGILTMAVGAWRHHRLAEHASVRQA